MQSPSPIVAASSRCHRAVIHLARLTTIEHFRWLTLKLQSSELPAKRHHLTPTVADPSVFRESLKPTWFLVYFAPN